VNRVSEISSEAGATVPPRRRTHLINVVRVVFALLVITFAVIAVATQWQNVSTQLRQMHAGPLLAAGALAILGVFASMLCWRVVLADLGSPLKLHTASRVFFLGQLGKYVPGSVWAVIAQAELAREHHVPRTRTGTAYVVLVVLYVGSGFLVGAITLPFVLTGSARIYLWLLLLIIPLVVILYPPMLTALLNRTLHLMRRPPMEHALSERGVVIALAWGAVSWLFLGLHIWLLARDLGGTGAGLLALSIGGFALAWCVGFVVIIAPAGVGPRDAIIAALFASALPAGGPAALAVVSRLMLTFADVICALAAIGIWRGRRGVDVDRVDIDQARG
jgi:glycosyltransferase 2 family protein